MSIIQVNALHFEYPDAIALKQIDFSLEAGTVTALTGASGAGKTTLLNCLAAISEPQRGEIFVDGYSTIINPHEVHQRVGYLPDYHGLYNELSVEHFLHYVAMARRLPYQEMNSATERVAALLDIENFMQHLAGDLSHGEAQRVAIAAAMLHQPKILLLDEPTSSLDPDERRHLSQVLNNLAEKGMTIVVSSNILNEISEFATHILTLDSGTIKQFTEIKSALAAAAKHRLLEMVLAREISNITEVLAANDDITNIHVDGKNVLFEFQGDLTSQQQLLKQLINQDLPICALTPANTSWLDVSASGMKVRSK